jgi:hypothetical protein
MKLLRVFNKSYLNVFQILARSFCDLEIEEDQLLMELVNKCIGILQNDDTFTEFHEIFNKDTESFLDEIFSRDETIFKECKIDFLNDIKFDKLWARFEDTEKDVFWKNIISLCRYSSMLNACGKQLAPMEEMALEFMKKQKNTSPDNYHMQLFQEMLGGGDMSKKLIETFKDPDTIKNILGNVGTIMRTTGDAGSGANDFTDILKMANMFDASEMTELQAGVVESLEKNVDGTSIIELLDK